MKFRIMVVDDHAIVLHGLTQLINSSTDLEVTMQAQSAESALAILASHPLPDLVVTDVSLPGLSGFDLTKTLTAQHPNLPILILSMHEEMVHGERAFALGRPPGHHATPSTAMGFCFFNNSECTSSTSGPMILLSPFSGDEHG